jgi:hypothetical protein
LHFARRQHAIYIERACHLDGHVEPKRTVQVEFRPRVDCERIDSESLPRGIQGLNSAEHLRAAHRHLVIHGGALEALGRLAGACQIVDIRRRDIGDAT